MAHWTKSFKKYERHFLLGLVILLLAVFSVTGAATQCSKGPDGGRSGELGGTFAVVGQAERHTLTDEEMAKVFDRYTTYLATVSMPTIDFATYLRQVRIPEAVKASWMHGLLARVAEEVGYRCGPVRRARAIKAVLGRSDRTSQLEVTPEVYERFISEVWARPASEFEQTLCEIVMKDELLSPLVDPARYDQTYAAAYEDWKSSRERVNLRYLALEGEPFMEEVRAEEETRRTLGEAEVVLRDVGDTARRMRHVRNMLTDHKNKTKGWPGSLDVLKAKENEQQTWALREGESLDAWKQPFVYVLGEPEPTVYSIGPDGKDGTADDVNAALVAQLETHAALAKVARGLTTWRNGGEPKVWPATLEAMLKPPVKQPGAAPALPALDKVPQDAWSRPFVYVAPATADGIPALGSAGPDGQDGTADDIKVEIVAERARVVPGPALAPFVKSDVVDRWGRPVTLIVTNDVTGQWQAMSLGKDGLPGTPDDLVGTNLGEIEAFYQQPALRTDFLQPMKRRFKALLMHVSLIPEATLKRLWEDYPALRTGPADEDKLFDRWEKGRGAGGAAKGYQFDTVDPRDPKDGHGLALARRLGWPEAAVLTAPSKETFALPTPSPGPEAPKEPEKAPDPLRKEYEEKGWREILIREEFLERVLYHHWKEVVTSRQAVQAWERKGEKVTPRPPEVTLEDLLSEQRLGKYQPGEADRAKGHRFLELFLTDKADKTPVFLSTEEIEALPQFGDTLFPVYLGPLKGNDVSPVPIQLNLRGTKVVVENVEVVAERVPPLSEVLNEVFERYLVRKRLARAERELAAFQRDAVKRAAERREGETDAAIWEATLAEWKKAHPGVTIHDETTGLFIGSRVPFRAPPAEDLPEAEKARQRRRDFVRQGGYGLVKQGAAKDDKTDAAPGTYGRSLLKDESTGAEATGAAYLVFVLERVYPTQAEFSPRRYAEHMATRVFGPRRGRPMAGAQNSLGSMEGTLYKPLATYFEEFTRLQPLFDLRTNRNLDSPPKSR